MTTVGGALGEGEWTLSKIDSIMGQVVSGMNYKITAMFTNVVTGDAETIEFVVYVAPNGTSSLVSAIPLMQ